MERDAWNSRRARINPPPGCLWLLWRSASTLTEPFGPDGNVSCWWHPIAWDDTRRMPWSHFYLHCGIEETCSPGLICIMCYQVLRHLSEHATSSIGKHLLAMGHIAQLNYLTDLGVSELTRTTIDEAALAILKRQGCRRITIVSLPKKIVFDS